MLDRAAGTNENRTMPATHRRRTPPGEGVGKGEVAKLRRDLGLTRKTFSRLTGYSERAIAGWESGKGVSESSRQRLAEVERLRKALSRIMRPTAIPGWLGAPNKAFAGLKPLEVIERGEIDRLWKMIFYLESGVVA
jgi:DNA-binding transcriptional regulator YiaG